MYVRRLKERQNVIKMFGVTHPHGFLVLEVPEPKGGCSYVVSERYVRIQGSRPGIMLTCIVRFMAITPIVSEREGLQ